MEAIVLIGLQASGKSTFFRERFFDTHVRISLDLLRTRNRVRIFTDACTAAKQPFVSDNTNATAEERARYIEPARAAGFRIVGYYFTPCPRDSVRRNRGRSGRAQIPDVGIFGTLKRLEPPARSEGFDALYLVELDDAAGFHVTELAGDAPPRTK